MIGIFDGDYASMTFGHADPAKGKAYDEAIISGVVTSPRVMRQMPRLLQAAGLQLVASFPYILPKSARPILGAGNRVLPAAGSQSRRHDGAGGERLGRRPPVDSAAGVFFGASNYYGYVARRP